MPAAVTTCRLRRLAGGLSKSGLVGSYSVTEMPG